MKHIRGLVFGRWASHYNYIIGHIICIPCPLIYVYDLNPFRGSLLLNVIFVNSAGLKISLLVFFMEDILIAGVLFNASETSTSYNRASANDLHAACSLQLLLTKAASVGSYRIKPVYTRTGRQR